MKYTKLFFTGILIFAIQALVNAQSAQNFKLKHKWEDISLTGSWQYNNTYNEVWGVVNEGREYAIIGSTYGTHFIDVTDSISFKEVGRVKGGTSGRAVVHRDYHDYKGHIYAVCDEGRNSTLQIIDFTSLPDSVSVVYDSDVLIEKSHNIFIDSSSARMYVCERYGLRIFSLDDPVKPKLLATYTEDGVHDLYVRNDTAYLSCGINMRIVDFTDFKNPNTLLILRDYQEKGYNHNGWLNENGNTFLFTDETKGMRVKVCSVSDLSNFDIVSMIQPKYSDSSMAHNVVIKGDVAYIAYYNDGVQVYDISNSTAPERIGYYNSGNYDTSSPFLGVWGVYPFLPSGKILISNMQKGLSVLEHSQGYILGSEEISSYISKIEVYPNPVKDHVNIALNLDYNEQVVVKLVDIKGARVKTLFSGPMTKGKHDLKISIGDDIAHSQYLLQVKVGEKLESFKVFK